MGSATHAEKSPTPTKPEDTNVNATTTSNGDQKDIEVPEAPKDQGEDGGEEVVEGGEEDTVIY